MERKENLFQPPEYQAEMFAEYFESAKAKALRVSEIEAILGDEYDLDELKEMFQAKREGRCVVLPCKPGGHMFEIFCGKVWEIIVCGFSIRNKREVVDYMRMHGGYVQCAAIEMDLDLFTREMYKTREAAEAALRREQE